MEYGTDYEVANRQITFTTAPVGMLYIYRETPTDRMVQFMEGSVLKATDMNISTLQQLHIIEENEDWTISNSIVIDDEDNAWEGRNLRIKNIADPLNAQDVVTKHYMETVQDGFVQENTKLKDEATKQANIATQQAQLATEKATTATQQANRAQAWAESPSSPDGEPDSKSSKTWAEEAATSAGSAAGSASTATTQADITTTKASEAASSAASALSSKNAAATSASNAATSESNAAKSANAAATSASNAATSESNAAKSANAAATSASNAAKSESNAAKSANAAASSAQQAAETAAGLGNPVSDVTENNGTITIIKSDGTQSNFKISIASEAEAKTGTNNTKHMTPLRVKQAIETLVQGVPVGTIFPFAGNTIPEGFLACNGAAVSRTTYAALFSAIGTTYGGGDGSTTFNLPAVEDNRFLEFSSTRGSKRNAGLPNITGKLALAGAPISDETTRGEYPSKLQGCFSGLEDNTNNRHWAGAHALNTYSNDAALFDASASNDIYGLSSTVQPKSLTVRAIIKY